MKRVSLEGAPNNLIFYKNLENLRAGAGLKKSWYKVCYHGVWRTGLFTKFKASSCQIHGEPIYSYHFKDENNKGFIVELGKEEKISDYFIKKGL